MLCLGQLDVTRASHEVEKRREPQARFRKQASRTVREHNPFASATFLAILVSHMDVSVAKAKNRLSELLRLAEAGENVLITRNGKPVARLVPVPPARRVVRFGTMRGHIHLKPGWDAPIDIDQFLTGEF